MARWSFKHRFSSCIFFASIIYATASTQQERRREKHDGMREPQGGRRLVQHSAMDQGNEEMKYSENDFDEQQTKNGIKSKREQQGTRRGVQQTQSVPNTTNPKTPKATKTPENIKPQKKTASQKKQENMEAEDPVTNTANKGKERDLYNRTLAS